MEIRSLFSGSSWRLYAERQKLPGTGAVFACFSAKSVTVPGFPRSAGPGSWFCRGRGISGAKRFVLRGWPGACMHFPQGPGQPRFSGFAIHRSKGRQGQPGNKENGAANLHNTTLCKPIPDMQVQRQKCIGLHKVCYAT